MKIKFCSYFMLVVMTFCGLAGCTSKASSTPQVATNEQVETYATYRLSDTLLEDKDYSRFLHDKASINTLVAFYNDILQSDKVLMLSAFNQAMQVKDFKGDKRFFYGTEEYLKATADLVPRQKALQINQNFFDFHQLKVVEGEAIVWEGIDYRNGMKIPILLGHQYKGIYELGDVLEIEFYSKIFPCEVVGFLAKETGVSYNGYIDEDLDTYIIFLYPPKLWPVDEVDDSFAGIVYFAMLNGEVATKASEQVLLSEIKMASEKSEFKDFQVLDKEGNPLAWQK